MSIIAARAGEGPWEQTTTLAENNRLGLDESTTLTYAGALDLSELQFLGLNYHQVLTPDGLAYDSSFTHSMGRPGLASLTALDFKSWSTTFESGLTYPVIRSREQNLRVSALVFAEDASSDTLGAPFSDDRLRGFRLRANYDQVDTWFGTVAQSQIIGTFSQGVDGFGSTSNGNPLASVANGRVDFSKFELTANRTQTLGAGFSLYGTVDATWAGSALLSAEQCTYGGLYIGRAFDSEALAGDRCALELGELRYDASIPNNPFKQTQLYAFADRGDLFRVDPSAEHAAPCRGLFGRRRPAPCFGRDNFTADVAASKGYGDPANQGWRGFFRFNRALLGKEPQCLRSCAALSVASAPPLWRSRPLPRARIL